MCLMLLSSETDIPDLDCTPGPGSLTIKIKCPSGEAVSCIIESTNVQGKYLFTKVEEITGVPTTLQMLSYRKHLIHQNIKLQ